MSEEQYSKEIGNYFNKIDEQIKKLYDISKKARKKGYDPETTPPIPLAHNMAERVIGLISAIAPQITDTDITKRIIELEKQYGILDWRISLIIAEEVAKEKFCKFKDKQEAIEIGVRIGFAYHTLGVVSSPIEGLTSIKIRKRKDNKEYFALQYSGPIRSAGGTGASVSILIADYVRKKMGYSEYDPSEEEIKRMETELHDFHERVTNLQYLPSKEEINFLVKNLPIQIDGDPSESVEVSNYKDLERIETNFLRNGPCLSLGEGLAQKAPKVWKQLSKWAKDFDMEHWNFLEEFLKIQKNIKAKQEKESETKEKISPDYTFIKDLVAGRPVLTYPLRQGGFRLRYGRARTTGYSSCALHPLTMQILNKYIAIGTQLKMERPGKATALTSCDLIEGPIIKLKNGNVIRIEDQSQLKEISEEIKQILFLGDILISYGDFLNRAHILTPPGYCEEWWAQELEKATVNTFGNLDIEKLSELTNTSSAELNQLLKYPIRSKITAQAAIILSKELNIPLHPYYTYHWKSLDYEALSRLIEALEKSNIKRQDSIIEKIIIPFDEEIKRTLELIGLPHQVATNEFIIIEKQDATAFAATLGFLKDQDLKKIKFSINQNKDKPILELINTFSEIKIRDKSGIFIGARMGRPEKAKMRKLTGSPHVLFPVGDEGGRLRCFQAALEVGKINSDFPIYHCSHCKKDTVFPVCETCDKYTKRLYHCKICGNIDKKECTQHGNIDMYKNQNINIKNIFNDLLKKLKTRDYPDLIKGVRGTSNKEHIPEHLIKGILRAKHNIFVNKDGTTRFDMTQLPITHFKPKEISTSIEKLKELGYEKDIHNQPLEDPNQILELKPQDVLLPASEQSPDPGADEVLFNLTKFLDDILKNLYNLDPYYKLEKPEDLAGHLVIALAPHTSAAITCRILGFSKTQGFFAHPLIHAATRRDCLTYNTFIPVFEKGIWKNISIGRYVETKDTKYKTNGANIGFVNARTVGMKSNKIANLNLKEISVHPVKEVYEIFLEDGRSIKCTKDHKILLKQGNMIEAHKIKKGNQLQIPFKFDFKPVNFNKIRLTELFQDLMGRDFGDQLNKYVCNNSGRKKARKKLGLTKHQLDNYLLRNSAPFGILDKLNIKYNKVGYLRDRVSLPNEIIIDEDLLYLFGLYIAEGFIRKGSRCNNISIAATETEIRNKIKYIFLNKFNLKPTEDHKDHLTYSGKLIVELFEWFGFGKKAREKRVPSKILNIPKKKLAAFLRGYYDGDGSVSKNDLRVTCDSVSEGLLSDITFALKRFGIYTTYKHYEKKPGKDVKEFYIKKGKKIPLFKITKLIINSKFSDRFAKYIGFRLFRKQKILTENINKCRAKWNKIESSEEIAYPKVLRIEKIGMEKTYCLKTEEHNFVANDIIVKNCDGDEASVTMLLDALLNFSRQYLPAHRGSTQDAPLVLTSRLIPSEVDDMAFDIDTVWKYPLEFYQACEEYKNPWDIELETFGKRLNTPKQYQGLGFTHDTSNMNSGVKCSAYKTLPSMEEKLKGQMDIAEKVRAVDTSDVAAAVIEKHFLRDIKGNLRKFSMQEFRCVKCNEKFRRPPLIGKCTKCSGRIIFTISEGSVVKYLQPSISLAEKYNLPAYLKQSLVLLQRRIEGVFGKEKEKQAGLGAWFG